jgi:trans-2,3-dihydro-3-hydroxyanthranilate isomerase
MQRIARELNFSETTFVIGRSEGRAKVRIFTPETELPFAGHPTLGTAAVVLGKGAPAGRIVLELGVGDVPVEVQPTPSGARCELQAPPATGVASLSAEAMVAALGLTASDLDPSLPPEIWTCGNPFAFVPLVSREAVARSRCPSHNVPGTIGVMPFARVGPNEVHCRVFCPGAGVPEDPATGSCNAPFAAYLHEHGALGEGETLTTHQGVEMGRPSLLLARMGKDEKGVLRPQVAGGVVFVAEGTMTV